ncbi:MAG: epoxyqueuosine reductase QueH [Candidatus Omnitrophica bacterium]|jgi:predicted adenine nucleotide alpha hydrolase (AANH) superfamily ATPase|nr:epoxyqueuosine reductase QueH [Candidatus Omnitrophota bacterium]
MKKVLLHICCGVCAFACINYLKEAGFYVEGFFCNPNIMPNEEYIKRKDAAEKVCGITSVKLNAPIYAPGNWDTVCSIYSNEPEGGRRCDLCYEFRLKETFHKAMELGFDFFTTTLSVSPHKKSKIINEIGIKIAPAYFMAIDFKKNDGFKKTMEFAKTNNIYRQNYCGCAYSIR